MFIVVSYDIVDDRRRSRVARFMEDHGDRVQKSVFECSLEEPELTRLKEKLLDRIDPEVDSVRFYRICNRCRSSIEILGAGPIKEEESVVIV